MATTAARIPAKGTTLEESPGPHRAGLRRWLGPDYRMGFLFTLPIVVLVLSLVAYPFCYALYLSMTQKYVGMAPVFVGFDNYVKLTFDGFFRRAVYNSFIFTAGSVLIKLVLGMGAALLLNQHFRFKRIVRASMLLPWIVPTVLSTLAWQWMFDATFSVFNWMLMNVGIISQRILWLGDGTLAMGCLITVNVWRGMPFFAITLLAGLQTVNPDLHEAAEIDGANAWQRFWRVTLPLIKPIMLVVVLFSMIATFADFQLIYVLTRGGPYSSTHVFGTYAYEIAMRAAKLGQGASISLTLFPFLLMVIVFQLWYIRRSD